MKREGRRDKREKQRGEGKRVRERKKHRETERERERKRNILLRVLSCEENSISPMDVM